jgi:glycosyltransferase involved in cell wall biosynthesis
VEGLAAAAPLLGETFHLVIVGDGDSRPELEAMRGSLGAAARAVHLLGARRDTPRLYRAFDLFVLSSRTEGLPLVLPEAMASGLPVLSTAVGGIPLVVVEGETGHLVPAGDATALGAQLARLASPEGRRAAQRMGARGRALALERYSSARMARDYLALYAAARG